MSSEGASVVHEEAEALTRNSVFLAAELNKILVSERGYAAMSNVLVEEGAVEYDKRRAADEEKARAAAWGAEGHETEAE